jgi:hypothetical protein
MLRYPLDPTREDSDRLDQTRVEAGAEGRVEEERKATSLVLDVTLGTEK